MQNYELNNQFLEEENKKLNQLNRDYSITNSTLNEMISSSVIVIVLPIQNFKPDTFKIAAALILL